MPIRFLNQNINDIKFTTIRILEETSIAIEGNWFLRKYLEIDDLNDFVDIEKSIQKFVDLLINLSKTCSILFIWDGFNCIKKFRVISKTNLSLQISNIDNVINKIKKSSIKFDDEFYIEAINRKLENIENIKVIRAPYLAMAQCVYYLRENVANYIFCKNDALLSDKCDEIINNFDFADQKIQIIKKSYFNYFHDTPNIKAYLLGSGCEFCGTIPEIANSFDFDDYKLKIKENTYLQKYLEKDLEYKNLFLDALINIKYHPIMTLSANLETLCTENVPSDLNLIFGERLPLFMYQEIFKCKISPLILNSSVFSFKKPNEPLEVAHFINLNLISKAFLGVLEKKNFSHSEMSQVLKDIFGMSFKYLTRENKFNEFLFNFVNKNFSLENKAFTKKFYKILNYTGKSLNTIESTDILLIIFLNEYTIYFKSLIYMLEKMNIKNDFENYFNIKEYNKEITKDIENMSYK